MGSSGGEFIFPSAAVFTAIGGSEIKVQYLLDEPFIMGGVLVIGTDGKTAYGFSEDLLGGFAPLDEITSAALSLSGPDTARL